MPLPVRNFQADLKRLAGAEAMPAFSDPKVDSAYQSPVAAPGADALARSGPTASRIAAMARSLLGTPDGIYFPPDPANSCASFVSTVLIRAGATHGREQVLGPGFTTRAAGLTQVTEAAGAVLVGRFPLTGANVLKAQPGDVVQWIESDGTIGHSGVAIGGGRVIAVSLHSGHVETYAINYRHNEFTAFQLHRFTH